mgnify:CR=1 FL=1
MARTSFTMVMLALTAGMALLLGRRRHLRRHLLRRLAANARDRHPPGPRARVGPALTGMVVLDGLKLAAIGAALRAWRPRSA